jgi:hypothetical protein
VVDPRNNSADYTENPALCIADYLANSTYGFGLVRGTEIPTAPLIAAANACDLPSNLAAGGTEPLYTCNGHFDLTLGKGKILENLLTSCAGRITNAGGQWIIWPGQWNGATPVEAPGTGQMSGGYRWKPTLSVRDLYNGVKGVYVCPFNNWQASDIPAYAQDSTHGYSTGLGTWNASSTYQEGDEVVYNGVGYVALTASTNLPPDQNPAAWDEHYQDINMAVDLNTRRWLDIQLPFTISASMAQRICKIELLRRRQFGTGTFRFNLAGYIMTNLDIIKMDLPSLGWVGKLLEVSAHRLTFTEQSVAGGTPVTLIGVEIDVQETDQKVYDWSPTEELTPQAYQQPALPSVLNPAIPTNVALESDYSTSVLVNGALQDTILVTWDTPLDGYVTNGGHMEVQYQPFYEPVSTGTVSIDAQGNATFSSPVLSYIFIGGLLADTSVSPALIFTVTSISGVSHAIVSPFPTTTIANVTYFLSAEPPWTGLPSVDPSVTQVVIHGVVDGQQYRVQVRSVNAGRVPSAWVTPPPITASGAHAPWCLIPGDVSDGHGGFTFDIRQYISGSDLLIDISSTSPVNSFSPTLAVPPDVSSATETVDTTTGAFPEGNYVAVLYQVDANQLYSPASDTAEFTISTAGQASFVWAGIVWDPTAAGYDVFCGPDIYHMGSVHNAPQMGTPPTTVSLAGPGGAAAKYGAPDPKFDHFRLRMRWAVNLGVWGFSVNNATPSYTVITVDTLSMIPDEFQNRTLFHIGTADLTKTQQVTYANVLSNDASSFTVPSPEGYSFNLNDTLVVMAQANIAGPTTIGDSLFVNSQTTGLKPGGLFGYDVIIWSGTGAGQERKVTANTTTTATVAPPWTTQPDSTSQFFFIASSYVYDIPTTTVVSSNSQAINVIGTIPITAYQEQQMLVEIATVDVNGNYVRTGAPMRPCWVFAAPSNAASGDFGPIQHP